MKATEMMIRSEIRQMLNEAGLNRDTIRGIVNDAIHDIITKQVKYVLDQRPERELDGVVKRCMDNNMQFILMKQIESVVREKLRWLDFKISVDMPDNSNKE